jgi:hypothetical protein
MNFGFVTPTGEMNLGEVVFAETERNSSLDGPSVIVSVNSDNTSTDSALEYDGSTIKTTTISTAVDAPSQNWSLIENKSAVDYLYVQYKGTGDNQNKVLTAAFDGTLTLETQKVPQSSGQVWQYVASSYPGHFNIVNQLTLKLLSADANDNVCLSQATSSLQQLWRLDAADTAIIRFTTPAGVRPSLYFNAFSFLASYGQRTTVSCTGPGVNYSQVFTLPFDGTVRKNNRYGQAVISSLEENQAYELIVTIEHQTSTNGSWVASNVLPGVQTQSGARSQIVVASEDAGDNDDNDTVVFFNYFTPQTG